MQNFFFNLHLKDENSFMHFKISDGSFFLKDSLETGYLFLDCSGLFEEFNIINVDGMFYQIDIFIFLLIKVVKNFLIRKCSLLNTFPGGSYLINQIVLKFLLERLIKINLSIFQFGLNLLFVHSFVHQLIIFNA